MSKSSQSVAFYDPTCGVCSETKNFIQQKKFMKNLGFSSLNDSNFKEKLIKKKIKFRKDNIYLLTKDGEYYFGSEAIFKILSYSNGFLRYIGVIGQNRVIIKITQPFYYLFARNRYRVSKILRLKPDSF